MEKVSRIFSVNWSRFPKEYLNLWYIFPTNYCLAGMTSRMPMLRIRLQTLQLAVVQNLPCYILDTSIKIGQNST